jgi:glutamate 5-kinase
MKLKRWVVKAGSRMVLDGGAILIRSWMQQLYHLRKQHHIEVIWVTSGAIAWAKQRTNFKKTKRTLPEKQALSAIGQPLVLDQYNVALQSMGMLGSQVLLTAGDMKDPIRRKNLQNTLNEILKWKVIPILNENDAVSTVEIQFGDNDQLASQVALMMNAEKLIILTDVDGLYDSDPKENKNAKLVSFLPNVDKKSLKAADQSLKAKSKKSKSASVGTGGMYSKLLAAQKAQEQGITTHFVKGDIPKNLISIAEGEIIGTQIGKKK